MSTLCKSFCCRLEAWLIVFCTGMTAASESHPCPCIPRNLCPRVFGASPVDEKVTGPMKPCSNPGTVHCCGTSVSLHEQHPIHIEVDEELKKEKLMAIVNNAIEWMNEQYPLEDIPREDKSIDTTKKNHLGCNTKQCNDIPEEISRNLNKTNTSASTVTGQNELFNSSNPIFSRPKLSKVISGNGSVEKVYIVYAENPNQNNPYLGKESKAQIVLPTKEPKNSTVWESTTEEGENEPQESSIDPIQVDTSIRENPDESLTQTKRKLSKFERQHQLGNRKSNRLQQLFPKRRPPPQVQSKSSQNGNENEQSGDDVELAVAESNLDEVSDTIDDHGVAEDYVDGEDVYDEVVSTKTEFQSQGSLPSLPTNTEDKSEQTESRRLPLPPRRLSPQPPRSEENKQTTKNALDLLRRRTTSRNNPTVHKPNEESMKTTQHEPVGEHIAMEMDELNVRVINDMMKTNFTGRPSSRSNSAFKSSRAPLKTTTINNRLASSLNRNNQEQKSTESPSQLRRPAASHNIQPLEPKSQTQNPSQTNQNHEQSTNHGTGLSEENKVHRFQLKARPTLRTQNTKLSPKLASPISMTQEQAFDPSTPNAQVPARRQPYMRTRARPQLTTPSTTDAPSAPQQPQSSEEQTKPPPSAPLFVRKRLPARDRLRLRVENTNKNKQNEEPKTSSPESQTTSKTILLRPGTANEEDTITKDGEYISNPLKSGLDLDGSGSDFDFQQYQSRGNGKFTAPRELETGFHPMPPMMESRELKVVGPLPGGFFDPASGFSDGEDIGLELPHSNFQTQFKNEGSFNQNTGPLTLLPPVFEIPQAQVTTRSQGLPKFPVAETQQSFRQEETPQTGEDLSTIQNQFGTLKNQYDTLLSRYAETLNIYIGQYKKLIKSAPPNIR